MNEEDRALPFEIVISSFATLLLSTTRGSKNWNRDSKKVVVLTGDTERSDQFEGGSTAVRLWLGRGKGGVGGMCGMDPRKDDDRVLGCYVWMSSVGEKGLNSQLMR